ncbi:HslU--HslV peptidase ATPase subunit [Wolinella succinogenes]|uniref:CLPY PROTEIN n=1 Tax=Wolinella succinogenes (strain ATCC 29543 / DSM 1740 / CCUG 13145 / JCM 31913 / LMG 7466 / NCTC 11488 / FDC 602W) TaxID=273121 RepID=Q7M8Z7_WOLSU|nr:HslU--HslV peptidase ATPase subunit [Wolinella succinogenes]CAE10371.1 CLPY PROTEIN [Wolinella succinogenes]HCZ19793.1 HslU--HslV peptidase ATPase subunit [Helicobacter sp.]
MTPKEIVAYLDEYIIGQKEAKKRVAIALRNRYRRMKLSKEMQEEVIPKNILMIGSTGVGKTEIARRMARMMGLPFIKVEASKYTEVGFVGRDVESMVRDLVGAAIALVKEEHKEKNQEGIDAYVIEKIVQKLIPPLPKGASEAKMQEYESSYERMKQRVINGEVDHLKIEIQPPKKSVDFSEGNVPPEIVRIQESLAKAFLNSQKEEMKKEVTVKEAKELLKIEASEALLDMETIKAEGLRRAEEEGIIFIDEMDKIAVSQGSSSRQDPSKEGVQRDLLPIVEGSTVSTKHGQIKTDYILFIAAGAFHLSKPSDLIPELQGRFPLRVELDSLDEETLYKILTQTKNSILKQYIALLETEGVELVFEDEAIRALAKLSQRANEKTEDIGARRLHTVIEKVLEEISFEAEEHQGEKVVITKERVHERLDDLVENVDVARYIL